MPTVCHANAAYAGLPASVKFDPPVSLHDFTVTMPSCPACGEGTVFLWVCGSCGNRDGSPSWCCGGRMLVRGAFVSVLGNAHSWQGCPLVGTR